MRAEIFKERIDYVTEMEPVKAGIWGKQDNRNN